MDILGSSNMSMMPKMEKKTLSHILGYINHRHVAQKAQETSCQRMKHKRKRKQYQNQKQKEILLYQSDKIHENFHHVLLKQLLISDQDHPSLLSFLLIISSFFSSPNQIPELCFPQGIVIPRESNLHQTTTPLRRFGL